jgi:hypothetical protein
MGRQQVFKPDFSKYKAPIDTQSPDWEATSLSVCSVSTMTINPIIFPEHVFD